MQRADSAASPAHAPPLRHPARRPGLAREAAASEGERRGEPGDRDLHGRRRPSSRASRAPRCLPRDALRRSARSEHGLGDRGRPRLRRFEQTEQRQQDQEVEEVLERQDARGDDVAALGRLRAEIAEPDRRRPRRSRRTAGRAADSWPSARATCRATAAGTARRSSRTSAMTPPSLFGMARRIA